MITEIGIIAGEIWHYLEQNPEVKLSDLTKLIDKPRDFILMSLGWLAREGHIKLDTKVEDFKIVLRKQ
ncbi:MAG: winged helix-turn-helix domain-containing protein [Candidatus Gygaella obscura]|nr:winged helix-turn-helix domain-containing protein [Candidatus Gygaella obscura]